MRNLIAFFKRFRVFMLFAMLQVFAFSTYFTYVSFPRSQYLTSASEVNGKILKVKHDVTKHFNLSYNNQKLQYENIALRKRLPQSYIQVQSKVVKIDDTLFHQQYDYIPATVINSTVDKRNNYFTLNVGSSHGIKPGMGVFSEFGIVGVIHNVSEHFAVVKSVLTKSINIPVMIEPSGAVGLLKWDGVNAKIGYIEGISNDMKVKLWSKVVTRNGTGIFPGGIPVGKVMKLEAVEGKPLWKISLYYSEDYRKIQRVYVIKNLLKTEQEKLESQVPIEEDEE